ncbi:MAG: PQQ-binding-like beta-propeller repeat protein, partial [Planctomycetes bacterium]|nr:PQQ-binding-like beta-propeller repeat protein [Planctomycetota bacterium]
EPMTPEAKDQSPAADPAEVARLLKSHDDTVQQPPNWPMQGGGPDRAGLAGTTLKTPLEAAWKFNTHGRVVTSAAIVDGIVYSGSESGTIVAVDEKRGQKLWQFDTSQPIRCSPAVAGGVVYCGSDSGILHALDARTGKPLWQFATGGAIQASPAIVGGVILFGANDHNLYALDRRTGRKLWNFRTSRSFIQAPPVVHGDHVFAAGWSDWVWCLDAKTGKPVWKSFIPVSIEAVAWYRDQLWVRSPYFVVRLDPADGSWQRIAETSYGYGGMAFVGDRLFQSGVLGQYGTLGATSVALNGETSPPPEQVAPTLKGVKMLTPATLRNPNLAPAEVSFRARMSVGMVAMQGSPELASMGTPLSLGDKLCFATLHGKVILTDLDGRPLWSHDLGAPSHAPPVAVNGLLVVGCDDGYVYAFRSKPDPEQEAK